MYQEELLLRGRWRRQRLLGGKRRHEDDAGCREGDHPTGDSTSLLAKPVGHGVQGCSCTLGCCLDAEAEGL